MEQEHRNKILCNIDKLMDHTTYDILMDACIKSQLLFDVMREQIELYPSKIERHRKLLEKITRRGPNAYEMFENILKEYFPDATEILSHTSYQMKYNDISIRENRQRLPLGDQRSSPTQTTNVSLNQVHQVEIHHPPNTSQESHSPERHKQIKLTEYKDVVTPKLNIHVKLSDKIHGIDASKTGTYSMQSMNRGVFVLVNNISFKNKKKRNGAEVDRDNLVALFRQMGFTIFVYENLYKEQFEKLIKLLKASPELRKHDSFVFALLSHGHRSDYGYSVEFFDHESLDVEDILREFNNENCQSLVGKPKIFIFPFCRGRLLDGGAVKTERDSSRDNFESERTIVTNIPTFYDMKICYSTIPGYSAFRDPDEGSWYVQAMCNVFSEHAHDTHLEDLLKLIGVRISIMRTGDCELQTTSNEDRGFNKTLYFNPGFHC